MKFNITAVIDIVFLLMIFFLLVCQFIVAENYEVAVPDAISEAQSPEGSLDKITTVTVMFDEAGRVSYAVGAEEIEAEPAGAIAEGISAEIDRQLQNLPSARRVVCLRVDKDVRFRYSKHALMGISQSSATDMKLSVVKQKQM